ncbi:MAG: MobF family relaxase [Verrucomicrobiota bacterium]
MLIRYSRTVVRFDQPCEAVAGAVEYFREHLKIGDYLQEGGRVEMHWFGEGAGRLGLAGACELADFERLCCGQHPATCEKLLLRDNGAKRRVCFFGQISAPKDVSIALLVGGDERIRGWWDEAVRETLQEIEATAATRVRLRGANTDRPTDNVVAAVVTHDASRALDPQLHTHICVMNLTFDGTENRWKSLQPSGFYRHQAYFREVCYNKLASRMLETGYELERARTIGFTITGFPSTLRARFSKRRAAIVHQAGVEGAGTQDDLQRITSCSRAAKQQVATARLQAGWRQEAGGDLETMRATITAATGRRRSPLTMDAAGALALAGEHVFERKSVVDPCELVREALIFGRGQVSLGDLEAEIVKEVESGRLLYQNDEIASRDGLIAEREFVGWAAAGRRQCPALGTSDEMRDFDDDQRAAVRQLLRSSDRIVILQGDAGTGKTRCLRAVVAGIEAAGGQVFGCAPSAGATDVLRKELTPAADTLQQLLVNESLQQAMRGRVILVDEAGLVSVRQMRDLCRLASQNDWRLVFVGDIKQHSSVEAGDALRCLQRYAGLAVARLRQIRRQKDPGYRQAVAALARGEAWLAFRKFVKLGAVQEIKHVGTLFRMAAADYVRTVAAGQSCLVISPVWSEIHAFTREVRRQLQAAGTLAAEERSMPTVTSMGWTRAAMRQVENYQPGDVITFHQANDGFGRDEAVQVLRREGRSLIVRTDVGRERRLDPAYTRGFDVGLPADIPVAAGERLLIQANDKTRGLKNGDLVEVATIGPDGTLQLKDGRVLPATFRRFTHGYAATSHSAQGKTVDRGIVLMAEDGLAAGNLRQAYVSNSRFEHSQVIYTTDQAAAEEAMGRPGDRKLAMEAVGATPEPALSESLHLDWREIAAGPRLGMGAG